MCFKEKCVFLSIVCFCCDGFLWEFCVLCSFFILLMIWVFVLLLLLYDLIFWLRNCILVFRCDLELVSLYFFKLYVFSFCLSLFFFNCNDCILFCLIFNLCWRVNCILVSFLLIGFRVFLKYFLKLYLLGFGLVLCFLYELFEMYSVIWFFILCLFMIFFWNLDIDIIFLMKV